MRVSPSALWCLGGAVWDRKLRLLGDARMGSSNPVREAATPGGVARNVAHNLRQLGFAVELLSVWGDDAAGRALRASCRELGIGLHAAFVSRAQATGSYSAVLQPDGNLLLGLAQLDALEALGPQQLASSQSQRAAATLQLADMNLRADTLSAWLAEPREGAAVLLAVSEPKMVALPSDLSRLDLLIANAGEWQAAGGNTELARRGLRRALITQGAQGVRCGHWQEGQWRWDRLAALPLLDDDALACDATGAGDAFAAGVLAALALGHADLRLAAAFGQRLAQRCLRSLHSVAPDITPELLLALENPDEPVPAS